MDSQPSTPRILTPFNYIDQYLFVFYDICFVQCVLFIPFHSIIIKNMIAHISKISNGTIVLIAISFSFVFLWHILLNTLIVDISLAPRYHYEGIIT